MENTRFNYILQMRQDTGEFYNYLLSNIDNTDIVGDCIYNGLSRKEVDILLRWVDLNLINKGIFTGFKSKLTRLRCIIINIQSCFIINA